MTERLTAEHVLEIDAHVGRHRWTTTKDTEALIRELRLSWQELDAAQARAESLAGQVALFREAMQAHEEYDQCAKCRYLLAQPPTPTEAKVAAALALAEVCHAWEVAEDAAGDELAPEAETEHMGQYDGALAKYLEAKAGV